jgi:hypothetical protein
MCYIPQVVNQEDLVQAPPLRQEQGSKNMKIACSIYSVPAYEASNSQEHSVFQIVPTHSFMKSSAETEIIMTSVFSFKLKGFRSKYRKIN